MRNLSFAAPFSLLLAVLLSGCGGAKPVRVRETTEKAVLTRMLELRPLGRGDDLQKYLDLLDPSLKEHVYTDLKWRSASGELTSAERSLLDWLRESRFDFK